MLGAGVNMCAAGCERWPLAAMISVRVPYIEARHVYSVRTKHLPPRVPGSIDGTRTHTSHRESMT
eukprot:7373019-Prymnesium_polylepis.1